MVTTAWVIEQGRAVGFDRVGVAPAEDSLAPTESGLELDRISAWLLRGFAGEMRYLHDPRRRGARALMNDAASVICCALVYDTAHPRSTETPPDPERGWVSRYAWGDDYHTLIEEKLEALRARLAAQAGESFNCKLYVDTGPILERAYAARAGLGWQGKNTCLLDPELGSFFFLGLLVTNLALEPTSPQADGCGACTLCLDACPTAALVEPYVLDARRCLSYLTIELRGPIPEDLRAPMGRHVFGCDICQDVCPYNRKSLVSDLAVFQPRQIPTSVPDSATKLENRNSKIAQRQPASQATKLPPSPVAPATGSTAPPDQSPVATRQSLFHPSLSWLTSLTEDEFKRLFHNSALKRAKHRGLLRNTIVAIGNSRNPHFRPLLERFAASADSLLAEHARWALDQLSERGEAERRP